MKASEETHDAVVIGSGFGGSFAAHIVAESGRRVLVLERGREWGLGSFPRLPDELFGNTWDPSNHRYGLYDIRSFRGVDALLSAGVGGGSLIYANVALAKDRQWFSTPSGTGESPNWPVTYDDLQPCVDEAMQLLGATPFPREYALARRHAFERAAQARGYDVVRTPLAVTFDDGSGAGVAPGVPFGHRLGVRRVQRETCRLCGQCILGCNFGAKNSLDLTVLRHANIEVRPQIFVYSIGRSDVPDYQFIVRYVDLSSGADVALGALPQYIRRLHCKVLVVAAGTFGSTELMLRSASAFPGISPMIGSGFSPNGDLLTFGSRIGRRRRGRHYASPDLDMAGGPTITTSVRVNGRDGARFYLQDGAIPDELAWLLYGVGPLRFIARALRAGGSRTLDVAGRDPRTRVGGTFSRTVPRSRLAHTIAVLGMGIDTADGQLRLDGDELQLSWNVRRSRRLLRQIEGAADDIIRTLGGRTWPTTLTSLARIVTVHPVGGLPMGTSRTTGVVDGHGEVFGTKGLFVTDGSAMPGAVGPNPSLTIAAFALRSGTRIVERLEEVGR